MNVKTPGFLVSIIDTAKTFGPEITNFVETSMHFAPYVSSAMNAIKFNRLERRMNEHKDQLLSINQLLAVSQHIAFIQERIGPLVFSDLLEEHEDAKVRYILAGFETVCIEENPVESLLINYFDTLRELRYADIKRLLYFSGFSDVVYEEYGRYSNEFALLRSIDQKLERLELVHIQKTWGGIEGIEYQYLIQDVNIRSYGKKFLEFIIHDFELSPDRMNLKSFDREIDKD